MLPATNTSLYVPLLLLLLLVAVGGGTTGGVIASRLAQDKSKSILLIEAGENPELNPNIDIPLFADKVRGSEWDWSYRTTPQKHACKSHEDILACNSIYNVMT